MTGFAYSRKGTFHDHLVREAMEIKRLLFRGKVLSILERANEACGGIGAGDAFYDSLLLLVAAPDIEPFVKLWFTRREITP